MNSIVVANEATTHRDDQSMVCMMVCLPKYVQYFYSFLESMTDTSVFLPLMWKKSTGGNLYPRKTSQRVSDIYIEEEVAQIVIPFLLYNTLKVLLIYGFVVVP